MKIHLKLLIVSLLIVIIFLVGIIIQLHVEKQGLKQIIKSEHDYKVKTFEKIFLLQGKSMDTMVYDYTYWDEMAEYAEGKIGREWIEGMLNQSVLKTYGIDFVWMYNLDGKLVYFISNLSSIPQIQIATNNLLAKLSEDRFCNFYVNTNMGVLEIRGATIHKTLDIKRNRQHKGYLFAGKILDNKFTAKLSELSGGKVTLSSDEQDLEQNIEWHDEVNITFHKPLKNYDGNTIGYINVSFESDMYHKLDDILAKNMTLFIIFGSVITLTILLSIIYYVRIPLRALSNTLSTEDTRFINGFIDRNDEFGDVSKLIMDFFSQKVQLINEIENRKIAEKSLEIEKERLDITLRSILDGVIVTDANQRIILFSNGAEEITEYRSDELLGSHVAEFIKIINENDDQYGKNLIEKVVQLRSHEKFANNTRVVTKNGNQRIIEGGIAFITDKDEINGIVIIFRDITEKEKMEEEMLKIQKLDSIGLIAGGIAHDFNNILTAILGNISFAIVSKDSRIIKDCLTNAENACEQAKKLTYQLLTFSKGGSPVKSLTSIGDILRDSSMFASSGSNVACQFIIPDDLWAVEIDKIQISQVINNLVINAIQAMPKGGLITIGAENISLNHIKHSIPLKDGNYLKIYVSDKGIGIPKEIITKIFDPFFTTKTKGNGLGLSTCYSIIRKHEGHISVESEEGVGTTFYIYLPAIPNVIIESDKKDDSTDFSGAGRVLIMDDDEFICQFSRTMLSSFGYDVALSYDGSEAIELYKRKKESNTPFDIVIMDLTIPGKMGGKEAIKILLEFDPEAKVIVSSGYSNDEVMSNFQKYGFKDAICKPYRIDDIIKVIKKVLVNAN